MSQEEIKNQIIKAGYDAVKQLIKVAKEDIIKPNLDDRDWETIYTTSLHPPGTRS